MNQFQEQCIHGEVTFLGYLSDDAFVAVVIPIVMIFANVKKAIGFDSEWLMHLKVKADISHGYSLVIFS
jgi:general stress protein CsbA